jgi:acetylornithine deacetylase/succinyl-diaminopimelate desuccinylase-like protein
VTVHSLSRYLARQVRSADLLITGVDRDVSLFDMTRHTDLGDLVMQAGRPVLVVPTAAKVIFDCVLVGWKDARESRLAVLNALPFLAKAAQVTVAEIAAEEDLPEASTDVADVVGWLKTHGVKAEPLAVAAKGDDAAQLSVITQDQKATSLSRAPMATAGCVNGSWAA